MAKPAVQSVSKRVNSRKKRPTIHSKSKSSKLKSSKLYRKKYKGQG